MQVTYLYHSGFVVEMEKSVLIFDYYKGELPAFSKEKQVYVFASHKHKDHFQPIILSWEQQYEKIQFVFGNDIKLNDKYLNRLGYGEHIRPLIHTMSAHQTLQLNDSSIFTLQSTDAGVAFLVTVEGKKIYHAGDLNWWHWEGESEAYLLEMKKSYQEEINRLKQECVDLAFIPVDPRLEKATFWGMEYFLENISVERLIPMHLWEHYEIIEQYKKEHLDKDWIAKIQTVINKGESFFVK